MTEEADGGPAKLTLGRLCVERVVPVRLEYHAHVDRGPGQPSLSKPRADDETARPSVAGLSRLGSGIFVTSDILFVCCLFRGSRRAGRAGPPECDHHSDPTRGALQPDEPRPCGLGRWSQSALRPRPPLAGPAALPRAARAGESRVLAGRPPRPRRLRLRPGGFGPAAGHCYPRLLNRMSEPQSLFL